MKNSLQFVKFMNEAVTIVQFLKGISYYTEPSTGVWGWEQMEERDFKDAETFRLLSRSTYRKERKKKRKKRKKKRIYSLKKGGMF